MILVTGAAGFIGFHLCRRLLHEGEQVVGIDSINDYYDVGVKYARLEELGVTRSDAEHWGQPVSAANFTFIRVQLENADQLSEYFATYQFKTVVNLAAQAGVRYSLTNPGAYVNSNIIGFVNILESCRHHGVKHLVYASSSSVYCLNEKMPLSTGDNVDHPISLYAASKKSNELMAHTYSHLFGLATTGLRFFTVYGPWGRPDMALFLFTKAMLAGKPIKVFNHGEMIRDFTYVADIVEGIVRVIGHPPAGNPSWTGLQPDPTSSPSPYRIYNIGNNNPIKLLDFIKAIERKLGIEAKKIFMDLQPGDVPSTYADVADLVADLGYQPATTIDEGINAFLDWYRIYYGVVV